MHEHLVLFDDQCPFCHQSVRRIIELDVHNHFLFAPLGGSTARQLLTGPQKALAHANSLIVIEHYDSTHRTFWIRSRAVLRIYWLIGNGWGLIGIFSFLPAIGDFIYNWVGAHRHQFKLKMPKEAGPKDRFLP